MEELLSEWILLGKVTQSFAVTALLHDGVGQQSTVQYVYPERQLAWQGDGEVRSFCRSPTGPMSLQKNPSKTKLLNVKNDME